MCKPSLAHRPTDADCLQVVARDDVVAPTFERECYSFDPHDRKFEQLPEHLSHLRKFPVGSPEITGALRGCVSDEHYVPTALAANGLDDEVSTEIRQLSVQFHLQLYPSCSC